MYGKRKGTPLPAAPTDGPKPRAMSRERGLCRPRWAASAGRFEQTAPVPRPRTGGSASPPLSLHPPKRTCRGQTPGVRALAPPGPRARLCLLLFLVALVAGLVSSSHTHARARPCWPASTRAAPSQTHAPRSVPILVIRGGYSCGDTTCVARCNADALTHTAPPAERHPPAAVAAAASARAAVRLTDAPARNARSAHAAAALARRAPTEYCAHRPGAGTDDGQPLAGPCEGVPQGADNKGVLFSSHPEGYYLNPESRPQVLRRG